MNAATAGGIVIPLSLDLTRFNRQLQVAQAQMAQMAQMGRLGGGGSARGSAYGQGGSNRTPFGNPSQGFGARLNGAMASTRFNMGGVSPLIGRTANVLGLEASTAAPLLALAGAAKTAAEALNTFREAMFTSGGTAGEQARLGGLGGAVGLSGAAMAEMSRTFAERISSDPMAMSFAGKAGIRDLPGAFGRLDKATNFIKAMDFITKAPEPEAIRAARVWKLEQLLPLRDMSPERRAGLERAAGIQSKVFSPEQIQGARDFQAAMAHLTLSSETLATIFGSAPMRFIGEFSERLANVLDKLSGVFNDPHGGDLLNPTGAKGAARRLQVDKQQDAIKANTRALTENTAATREGMTNNGPRTNAAFGKHWGNADVPGRWVGEGFRMGALG